MTMGTSLPELPAPWLEALVQAHLPPADRLALFRTSKGLATAVLQHAACTELCLTWAASNREQRAAYLMQQLCAHARSLRVTLMDGITALWANLPKDSITHLTLASKQRGGWQVSAQQLRGLQLQQCAQLRSLCLRGGVRFSMSACEQAKLQRTPASWLPASLRKLELLGWGHAAHDVCPLIHSLSPQLTEIHMQGTRLNEQYMECLVQLPQLQAITADGPALTGPRTTDRHWQLGPGRTWQQLAFRHANLDDVARLPLSSIQQLVLHNGLQCPPHLQDTQKAAAALACCQRVDCIPGQGITSECTASGEAMHFFTLMACCTADIIALCGSHLSGGLHLDLMPMDGPAEQLVHVAHCLPGTALLPGITRLAPSVTWLRLNLVSVKGWEQGSAAVFWQQFAAALPHSVTHLVMEGVLKQWLVDQAAALAEVLSGSKHPARMMVVAFRTSMSHSEEAARRALQELAAAHPQRVQRVTVRHAQVVG